jgi:polysaccharide biosynthesis transport protein
MSSGEEKDRPFHPLKPVPAGGGQVVPYDPRTLVPEEDDSIDLREYWRILVKRKWLILAVLAIVIAATFMATRLQVPEYRATTSVMIQMPVQNTVLAIQDYDAAWYRHQEFLPTQLQILNSRALAEAVVRREGLENHPQLTGQVRQRSLLTRRDSWRASSSTRSGPRRRSRPRTSRAVSRPTRWLPPLPDCAPVCRSSRSGTRPW